MSERRFSLDQYNCGFTQIPSIRPTKIIVKINSGSTVENIESEGIYVFAVTADGPWSINIE
jgi:hypothetical protein